MSSTVNPVISNTNLIERTGPNPITFGSKALVAEATTLASGFNPFSFTTSPLATTTEAAPSTIPLELAAV